MIKLVNDVVNETIEFLNNRYPSDKDVYISIVRGCSMIMDNTIKAGETGFGTYVKDTKTIYIAGNMPDQSEEMIIRTIGHEYGHFLQDIDDTGFDEEQAEQFGFEVYESMRITI